MDNKKENETIMNENSTTCSNNMVNNKFGTKEWSDYSCNIQKGCENGCLYCYAHYNAVCGRFKYMTQEQWDNPVIDNKKVDKGYRKRNGVIMYPTTHDITLFNIEQYLCVLRKLLDAGNKVLIVSKPNWNCITIICEAYEQYKNQMMFRFTIGSMNNDVLRFWEPNAPNYDERLACLQYAFKKGYATSVSCEPYLDHNILPLYSFCQEFITDSFWIGKLNRLDQRVDISGICEADRKKYIESLRKLITNKAIIRLYEQMKDLKYILWKDSITKIINLKTVAGPS